MDYTWLMFINQKETLQFFNNSMQNAFGQALTSNPMVGIAGDYVLSGTQKYLQNMQISGYTSKIFSPQMRAFFDVDTETVKNKIIKLLMPFKQFAFDESIKKLELYLPIVSFMTLIMFSTLLQGLITDNFTPKIGKRTTWILIFTMIQVLLAKFTQNAISNLKLGIIELVSLVSYRFVSLSAVTMILVVLNLGLSPLRYIGVIYVLAVDTYFCKLQLQNCSKDLFKAQGGLGNKVALGVHILTTLVMMWSCSLL